MHGVRSLMVEGGARVIRAFLSAASCQVPPSESSESPGGAKEKANSVDALVVTVAPSVVGEAGVGYGPGLLAETVSPSLHNGIAAQVVGTNLFLLFAFHVLLVVLF